MNNSIITPALGEFIEFAFNMIPSPIREETTGLIGAMDNTIGRLRTKARKMGLPWNPVGASDEKTAVPSTYRPVRNKDGKSTCPRSCKFSPDNPQNVGKDKMTCYALDWRVGYAQRNSKAETLPGLVSAVTAIAVGLLFDTRARLHVSGDNGKPDGEVDFLYLEGLCEIGAAAKQHFNVNEVAFSYTHFTDEELGGWRDVLLENGVVFRRSDKWGAMGAVTFPHEHFRELKAALPGVKLFRCLAQLTDNSKPCRECKACWALPEHIIVFDGHGSAGAKLNATWEIPVVERPKTLVTA